MFHSISQNGSKKPHGKTANWHDRKANKYRTRAPQSWEISPWVADCDVCAIAGC